MSKTTLRTSRSRRNRRGALNAAATVFCVLWIFPVYWMVNTAFKPYGDILRPTPGFLPIPLSLGNFADALRKPMFGDYLRNSLIVTGLAVVVGALVALLAAVALTRFRFFGRRAFLVAILVVQTVPNPALVIPIFLSLKSANLLNSLPGLSLTYLAFVLPFTIWTLRGFLHGVPVELEEAAMVDGAGRLTVIRRILLPLVAPGVIASSVFAFITAWNDYVFAYVEMKDQDHYTLPVWLVSFSTSTGTDYGGLIAASTLFALPVVVFFLVIQRRLVEGMTSGAVKD
ncbi:MAG TPA: carbohydrate ABC transporter permease [Actinospica sp.]|nr:carbohydrate ABC transporter permease [Actinospica sp.]